MVVHLSRERCYRTYHPWHGGEYLWGYSARDGPNPKAIPDLRGLGVLSYLLSVQFRLKFCQPLLSERMDRACLELSLPHLAFCFFVCLASFISISYVCVTHRQQASVLVYHATIYLYIPIICDSCKSHDFGCFAYHHLHKKLIVSQFCTTYKVDLNSSEFRQGQVLCLRQCVCHRPASSWFVRLILLSPVSLHWLKSCVPLSFPWSKIRLRNPISELRFKLTGLVCWLRIEYLTSSCCQKTREITENKCSS